MSVEPQVDCPFVSERLPWLLTGALDPEEARQLRAHLASCPTCRRDLHSARLAGEVFEAHLPAAVLVDLAWNRPPGGIEPELARRHLERCPTCAEQLALARESRRLESEAEAPSRVPSFASAPWRWGALAAVLPLAFVGGAVWRASRDSAHLASLQVQKRNLEARVGDLQGELERGQVKGRVLEHQVERLAEPQPNVAVIEVFPNSSAMRSVRSAGESQVTMPADAAWVVLLLNLERTPTAPATVEVRDSARAVIWQGAGLRPNQLGGYTLAIPSRLLPQARYEVTLFTPARTPLAVYSLRLRQTD